MEAIGGGLPRRSSATATHASPSAAPLRQPPGHRSGGRTTPAAAPRLLQALATWDPPSEAATADRRHPAADPVPQWPNCPLVGNEGVRRPPPVRPRGAHCCGRRAYVGRLGILHTGRHAPGCGEPLCPGGSSGARRLVRQPAAGGHGGATLPISTGTADRGSRAQRAGLGPAAPDLDSHGVWGLARPTLAGVADGTRPTSAPTLLRRAVPLGRLENLGLQYRTAWRAA